MCSIYLKNVINLIVSTKVDPNGSLVPHVKYINLRFSFRWKNILLTFCCSQVSSASPNTMAALVLGFIMHFTSFFSVSGESVSLLCKTP